MLTKVMICQITLHHGWSSNGYVSNILKQHGKKVKFGMVEQFGGKKTSFSFYFASPF